MKWMDRSGRLFSRISILDVLAVAVVLVLAAALYFKDNQTHTGTSVSDTIITYQVLVQGVRGYTAEAIQVGDEMFDFDRSSGGSLGTITAIETMPGQLLADLQDGTIEFIPAEGCVDLRITVEGSGLISEGRYLLNRVYDLGVNSARNYYTKFAKFTGVVEAIQ